MLMPQLSSADDDDRVIAEGQDAPGAAKDSGSCLRNVCDDEGLRHNVKYAKETVDLFMEVLDRRGNDNDRFVAGCAVALDMNSPAPSYVPNNVVMDLNDGDSFDIHDGDYNNLCPPIPAEDGTVVYCTADKFECCVHVDTDQGNHDCTLPFLGILPAGDPENEDEFERDWAVYDCDSRDDSDCARCLAHINSSNHPQSGLNDATFWLREVANYGDCASDTKSLGDDDDGTIRIGGPFDFVEKD
jgi:hypothetical protein